VWGTAALLLASEEGAFRAHLPRLAWMTVSYLLYFAAFIGLSLAVSAMARTGRLALVCLLGFWIFNGLAAPRLMSDVSRTLCRTPSSFAFAREMELELKKEQSEEALKRKVLAQYKVEKMEDLPVNFQGIALQASEEHGNEVYDRLYGQLWDTFEEQNRLQQQAAVIAPLLAMRSVSMGLSGTDFAQFRDFSVAAEQYRRKLIEVMNDDITKTGKQEGPHLGDEQLWAKVPPFVYEAPGVGRVLGQQAWSLSLLALWAASAAALAGWAAARRLRAE
jgi:ABC-2 type transport system permease protein